MDKLHVEAAGLDVVAGLDGDELGAFGQTPLLQLQLHEPGGEAGAVNGRAQLIHHIGQGADVVFVAVGEDNGADALFILHQPAHIGDDHVHAVHLLVGKAHTAVHHKEILAIFIHSKILADLVETAKRDHFQFGCHNYSYN